MSRSLSHQRKAREHRRLDRFKFAARRGLLPRILLLMTPLVLSGCYYPYGYYPYGYYPNGPYPYGYGGQPYGPYAAQPQYSGGGPYGSGSADRSYAQPPASDPNNCGTPDEPIPCHRW